MSFRFFGERGIRINSQYPPFFLPLFNVSVLVQSPVEKRGEGGTSEMKYC
jgi:hypothetical protein